MCRRGRIDRGSDGPRRALGGCAARAFGGALALAVCVAAAAPASDLADPTRPAFALPPVPTGPAAPAARLTAVLVAPDARRAELDGRWVRVGDRVGDARVVEITLDGVRLRGRNGTFSIPLLATRVEKRPAEGGEAR